MSLFNLYGYEKNKSRTFDVAINNNKLIVGIAECGFFKN